MLRDIFSLMRLRRARSAPIRVYIILLLYIIHGRSGNTNSPRENTRTISNATPPIFGSGCEATNDQSRDT